MGYRWMPITSDFDRSLPISKVRCDTTISPSTGSQDGYFSELPNKNCDGKAIYEVSGAEWGYADANRFNFYYKYFSNRFYNFIDEYWTAQTHTTKVEGTEGTYEFVCPVTYYWGGMNSTSDYDKISAFLVYVQVSVFEPSKSVFKFSSLGGSESFTLEAYSNWTATTASDWVSLSQSTGSTGGSITLTCNRNYTETARTATITFTNADEDTFNITVNQKRGTAFNSVNRAYRNGNVLFQRQIPKTE